MTKAEYTAELKMLVPAGGVPNRIVYPITVGYAREYKVKEIHDVGVFCQDISSHKEEFKHYDELALPDVEDIHHYINEKYGT